jgi:hypothetical protein
VTNIEFDESGYEATISIDREAPSWMPKSYEGKPLDEMKTVGAIEYAVREDFKKRNVSFGTYSYSMKFLKGQDQIWRVHSAD